MQNPDAAAAAAATLRDAAEERALLRQAVVRLEMRTVPSTPFSTPTSRLTKLEPEDDVEAYLEIFERTARGEGWPEDQWAHILGPFLTGPAQQESQDLTPEQASRYPTLKQAVLAYYGHSLAARAQRFRDWRFDPHGAVRSQIAQHGRLIRRWLAGDDGPSLLDRVLLDNTIRQLPPDARRTLALHHPNTVDELICQLEKLAKHRFFKHR